MTLKTIRFLFCLALGAAIGCGEDDASRAELEVRLAEMQGTVADLQDQLDDASDAAATSNGTVASLQSSLADAQAALTAAQADLATANASVATLTAQLATIQGQLSALQQILDGLAGTLELHLPLRFGSAALELGTSYPIPGTPDSVSFSEVRYWLSNVELIRGDGSSYAVPDSYFLVEARGDQVFDALVEDPLPLPARRRETIVLDRIPAGVYTGIRFHVGIDPTHNDNFANYAGELHVLQNMVDIAWMWLTSYVFTKTHGTVTGESTVNLSWENGTNADYREVAFTDFPIDVTLSVQHPHRVEIATDLASLVTDVGARAHPAIGAGSASLRTTLADAFRDMFSLVAVEPITEH